jgi:(2Fe-2S) ferredoxin
VSDRPRRLTVVVCRGPVCGDSRGSAALTRHLAVSLAARRLTDRVQLREEVCFGHCLRGPNILVHDDDDAAAPANGVLYNRMTVDELDRVIDKHLVGGMAVRIFTNRPPFRG